MSHDHAVDYGPKKSLLTPFFGGNHPNEDSDPNTSRQHPCVRLSREVHQCLEENNNAGHFCISRVTKLEHCLRDFNI